MWAPVSAAAYLPAWKHAAANLTGLLTPALAALPFAEEAFDDVLCHRLSQCTAGLQRMEEVETGVDARPEDLVHQVTGIFKNVLVDAMGEGFAIGDNVDLCGAEKRRDHRGCGARQAAMRRGIFRMVGVVPSADQFGSAVKSELPPPAGIAVTGLQKP